MIPPRTPHAWMHHENEYYPVLVRGWEKKYDTNGYPGWWAHCVILHGEDVRESLVPREWLKPIHSPPPGR